MARGSGRAKTAGTVSASSLSSSLISPGSSSSGGIGECGMEDPVAREPYKESKCWIRYTISIR